MAWFETVKKELDGSRAPQSGASDEEDNKNTLRGQFLKVDGRHASDSSDFRNLDILCTDNYTRTVTRRKAIELLRVFQRSTYSERRNPTFIQNARMQLAMLRLYNNGVLMQKKRYPRTKWMFHLLCRFVALEFEALGPNPDPSNCGADKLVSLLESVLSKYFDEDQEIRCKVFIVHIIVTAYNTYHIPQWYMDTLAGLALKGTIIQKQIDELYSGDEDVLCVTDMWFNDALKYFTEKDDFGTDDEASDASGQDESPPNDTEPAHRKEGNRKYRLKRESDDDVIFVKDERTDCDLSVSSIENSFANVDSDPEGMFNKSRTGLSLNANKIRNFNCNPNRSSSSSLKLKQNSNLDSKTNFTSNPHAGVKTKLNSDPDISFKSVNPSLDTDTLNSNRSSNLNKCENVSNFESVENIVVVIDDVVESPRTDSDCEVISCVIPKVTKKKKKKKKKKRVTPIVIEDDEDDIIVTDSYQRNSSINSLEISTTSVEGVEMLPDQGPLTLNKELNCSEETAVTSSKEALGSPRMGLEEISSTNLSIPQQYPRLSKQYAAQTYNSSNLIGTNLPKATSCDPSKLPNITSTEWIQLTHINPTESTKAINIGSSQSCSSGTSQIPSKSANISSTELRNTVSKDNIKSLTSNKPINVTSTESLRLSNISSTDWIKSRNPAESTQTRQQASIEPSNTTSMDLVNLGHQTSSVLMKSKPSNKPKFCGELANSFSPVFPSTSNSNEVGPKNKILLTKATSTEPMEKDATLKNKNLLMESTSQFPEVSSTISNDEIDSEIDDYYDHHFNKVCYEQPISATISKESKKAILEKIGEPKTKDSSEIAFKLQIEVSTNTPNIKHSKLMEDRLSKIIAKDYNFENVPKSDSAPSYSKDVNDKPLKSKTFSLSQEKPSVVSLKFTSFNPHEDKTLKNITLTNKSSKNTTFSDFKNNSPRSTSFNASKGNSSGEAKTTLEENEAFVSDLNRSEKVTITSQIYLNLEQTSNTVSSLDAQPLLLKSKFQESLIPKYSALKEDVQNSLCCNSSKNKLNTEPSEINNLTKTNSSICEDSNLKNERLKVVCGVFEEEGKSNKEASFKSSEMNNIHSETTCKVIEATDEQLLDVSSDIIPNEQSKQVCESNEKLEALKEQYIDKSRNDTLNDKLKLTHEIMESKLNNFEASNMQHPENSKNEASITQYAESSKSDILNIQHTDNSKNEASNPQHAQSSKNETSNIQHTENSKSETIPEKSKENNELFEASTKKIAIPVEYLSIIFNNFEASNIQHAENSKNEILHEKLNETNKLVETKTKKNDTPEDDLSNTNPYEELRQIIEEDTANVNLVEVSQIEQFKDTNNTFESISFASDTKDHVSTTMNKDFFEQSEEINEENSLGLISTRKISSNEILKNISSKHQFEELKNASNKHQFEKTSFDDEMVKNKLIVANKEIEDFLNADSNITSTQTNNKATSAEESKFQENTAEIPIKDIADLVVNEKTSIEDSRIEEISGITIKNTEALNELTIFKPKDTVTTEEQLLKEIEVNKEFYVIKQCDKAINDINSSDCLENPKTSFNQKSEVDPIIEEFEGCHSCEKGNINEESSITKQPVEIIESFDDNLAERVEECETTFSEEFEAVNKESATEQSDDIIEAVNVDTVPHEESEGSLHENTYKGIYEKAKESEFEAVNKESVKEQSDEIINAVSVDAITEEFEVDLKENTYGGINEMAKDSELEIVSEEIIEGVNVDAVAEEPEVSLKENSNEEIDQIAKESEFEAVNKELITEQSEEIVEALSVDAEDKESEIRLKENSYEGINQLVKEPEIEDIVTEQFEENVKTVEASSCLENSVLEEQITVDSCAVKKSDENVSASRQLEDFKAISQTVKVGENDFRVDEEDISSSTIKIVGNSEETQESFLVTVAKSQENVDCKVTHKEYEKSEILFLENEATNREDAKFNNAIKETFGKQLFITSTPLKERKGEITLFQPKDNELEKISEDNEAISKETLYYDASEEDNTSFEATGNEGTSSINANLSNEVYYDVHKAITYEKCFTIGADVKTVENTYISYSNNEEGLNVQKRPIAECNEEISEIEKDLKPDEINTIANSLMPQKHNIDITDTGLIEESNTIEDSCMSQKQNIDITETALIEETNTIDDSLMPQKHNIDLTETGLIEETNTIEDSLMPQKHNIDIITETQQIEETNTIEDSLVPQKNNIDITDTGLIEESNTIEDSLMPQKHETVLIEETNTIEDSFMPQKHNIDIITETRQIEEINTIEDSHMLHKHNEECSKSVTFGNEEMNNIPNKESNNIEETSSTEAKVESSENEQSEINTHIKEDTSKNEVPLVIEDIQLDVVSKCSSNETGIPEVSQIEESAGIENNKTDKINEMDNTMDLECYYEEIGSSLEEHIKELNEGIKKSDDGNIEDVQIVALASNESLVCSQGDENERLVTSYTILNEEIISSVDVQNEQLVYSRDLRVDENEKNIPLHEDLRDVQNNNEETVVQKENSTSLNDTNAEVVSTIEIQVEGVIPLVEVIRDDVISLGDVQNNKKEMNDQKENVRSVNKTIEETAIEIQEKEIIPLAEVSREDVVPLGDVQNNKEKMDVQKVNTSSLNDTNKDILSIELQGEEVIPLAEVQVSLNEEISPLIDIQNEELSCKISNTSKIEEIFLSKNSNKCDTSNLFNEIEEKQTLKNSSKELLQGKGELELTTISEKVCEAIETLKIEEIKNSIINTTEINEGDKSVQEEIKTVKETITLAAGVEEGTASIEKKSHEKDGFYRKNDKVPSSIKENEMVTEDQKSSKSFYEPKEECDTLDNSEISKTSNKEIELLKGEINPLSNLQNEVDGSKNSKEECIKMSVSEPIASKMFKNSEETVILNKLSKEESDPLQKCDLSNIIKANLEDLGSVVIKPLNKHKEVKRKRRKPAVLQAEKFEKGVWDNSEIKIGENLDKRVVKRKKKKAQITPSNVEYKRMTRSCSLRGKSCLMEKSNRVAENEDLKIDENVKNNLESVKDIESEGFKSVDDGKKGKKNNLGVGKRKGRRAKGKKKLEESIKNTIEDINPQFNSLNLNSSVNLQKAPKGFTNIKSSEHKQDFSLGAFKKRNANLLQEQLLESKEPKFCAENMLRKSIKSTDETLGKILEKNLEISNFDVNSKPLTINTDIDVNDERLMSCRGNVKSPKKWWEILNNTEIEANMTKVRRASQELKSDPLMEFQYEKQDSDQIFLKKRNFNIAGVKTSTETNFEEIATVTSKIKNVDKANVSNSTKLESSDNVSIDSTNIQNIGDVTEFSNSNKGYVLHNNTTACLNIDAKIMTSICNETKSIIYQDKKIVNVTECSNIEIIKDSKTLDKTETKNIEDSEVHLEKQSSNNESLICNKIDHSSFISHTDSTIDSLNTVNSDVATKVCSVLNENSEIMNIEHPEYNKITDTAESSNIKNIEDLNITQIPESSHEENLNYNKIIAMTYSLTNIIKEKEKTDSIEPSNLTEVPIEDLPVSSNNLLTSEDSSLGLKNENLFCKEEQISQTINVNNSDESKSCEATSNAEIEDNVVKVKSIASEICEVIASPNLHSNKKATVSSNLKGTESCKQLIFEGFKDTGMQEPQEYYTKIHPETTTELKSNEDNEADECNGVENDEKEIVERKIFVNINEDEQPKLRKRSERIKKIEATKAQHKSTEEAEKDNEYFENELNKPIEKYKEKLTEQNEHKLMKSTENKEELNKLIAENKDKQNKTIEEDNDEQIKQSEKEKQTNTILEHNKFLIDKINEDKNETHTNEFESTEGEKQENITSIKDVKSEKLEDEVNTCEDNFFCVQINEKIAVQNEIEVQVKKQEILKNEESIGSIEQSKFKEIHNTGEVQDADKIDIMLKEIAKKQNVGIKAGEKQTISEINNAVQKETQIEEITKCPNEDISENTINIKKRNEVQVEDNTFSSRNKEIFVEDKERVIKIDRENEEKKKLKEKVDSNEADNLCVKNLDISKKSIEVKEQIPTDKSKKSREEKDKYRKEKRCKTKESKKENNDHKLKDVISKDKEDYKKSKHREDPNTSDNTDTIVENLGKEAKDVSKKIKNHDSRKSKRDEEKDDQQKSKSQERRKSKNREEKDAKDQKKRKSLQEKESLEPSRQSEELKKCSNSAEKEDLSRLKNCNEKSGLTKPISHEKKDKAKLNKENFIKSKNSEIKNNKSLSEEANIYKTPNISEVVKNSEVKQSKEEHTKTKKESSKKCYDVKEGNEKREVSFETDDSVKQKKGKSDGELSRNQSKSRFKPIDHSKREKSNSKSRDIVKVKEKEDTEKQKSSKREEHRERRSKRKHTEDEDSKIEKSEDRNTKKRKSGDEHSRSRSRSEHESRKSKSEKKDERTKEKKEEVRNKEKKERNTESDMKEEKVKGRTNRKTDKEEVSKQQKEEKISKDELSRERNEEKISKEEANKEKREGGKGKKEERVIKEKKEEREGSKGKKEERVCMEASKERKEEKLDREEASKGKKDEKVGKEEASKERKEEKIVKEETGKDKKEEKLCREISKERVKNSKEEKLKEKKQEKSRDEKDSKEDVNKEKVKHKKEKKEDRIKEKNEDNGSKEENKEKKGEKERSSHKDKAKRENDTTSKKNVKTKTTVHESKQSHEAAKEEFKMKTNEQEPLERKSKRSESGDKRVKESKENKSKNEESKSKNEEGKTNEEEGKLKIEDGKKEKRHSKQKSQNSDSKVKKSKEDTKKQLKYPGDELNKEQEGPKVIEDEKEPKETKVSLKEKINESNPTNVNQETNHYSNENTTIPLHISSKESKTIHQNTNIFSKENKELTNEGSNEEKSFANQDIMSPEFPNESLKSPSKIVIDVKAAKKRSLEDDSAKVGKLSKNTKLIEDIKNSLQVLKSPKRKLKEADTSSGDNNKNPLKILLRYDKQVMTATVVKSTVNDDYEQEKDDLECRKITTRSRKKRKVIQEEVTQEKQDFEITESNILEPDDSQDVAGGISLIATKKDNFTKAEIMDTDKSSERIESSMDLEINSSSLEIADQASIENTNCNIDDNVGATNSADCKVINSINSFEQASPLCVEQSEVSSIEELQIVKENKGNALKDHIVGFIDQKEFSSTDFKVNNASEDQNVDLIDQKELSSANITVNNALEGHNVGLNDQKKFSNADVTVNNVLEGQNVGFNDQKELSSTDITVNNEAMCELAKPKDTFSEPSNQNVVAPITVETFTGNLICNAEEFNSLKKIDNISTLNPNQIHDDETAFTILKTMKCLEQLQSQSIRSKELPKKILKSTKASESEISDECSVISLDNQNSPIKTTEDISVIYQNHQCPVKYQNPPLKTIETTPNLYENHTTSIQNTLLQTNLPTSDLYLNPQHDNQQISYLNPNDGVNLEQSLSEIIPNISANSLEAISEAINKITGSPCGKLPVSYRDEPVVYSVDNSHKHEDFTEVAKTLEHLKMLNQTNMEIEALDYQSVGQITGLNGIKVVQMDLNQHVQTVGQIDNEGKMDHLQPVRPVDNLSPRHLQITDPHLQATEIVDNTGKLLNRLQSVEQMHSVQSFGQENNINHLSPPIKQVDNMDHLQDGIDTNSDHLQGTFMEQPKTVHQNTNFEKPPRIQKQACKSARKIYGREKPKTFEEIMNSLRDSDKLTKSPKYEENNSHVKLVIHDFNEQPDAVLKTPNVIVERIPQLYNTSYEGESTVSFAEIPKVGYEPFPSQIDRKSTEVRYDGYSPRGDEKSTKVNFETLSSPSDEKTATKVNFDGFAPVDAVIGDSNGRICGGAILPELNVSKGSDGRPVDVDEMPLDEKVRVLGKLVTVAANPSTSGDPFFLSVSINNKKDKLDVSRESLDCSLDENEIFHFSEQICSTGNLPTTDTASPVDYHLSEQVNHLGFTFPWANLGLTDMDRVSYGEDVAPITWTQESVMKLKESYNGEAISKAFMTSSEIYHESVLQTPRIVPAALEDAIISNHYTEENKRSKLRGSSDADFKEEELAPLTAVDVESPVKVEEEKTGKKRNCKKLSMSPRVILNRINLLNSSKPKAEDASDKKGIPMRSYSLTKVCPPKRKLADDDLKTNERKRLAAPDAIFEDKIDNTKRPKFYDEDDDLDSEPKPPPPTPQQTSDLFDTVKNMDVNTLPIIYSTSAPGNIQVTANKFSNVRKANISVKETNNKANTALTTHHCDEKKDKEVKRKPKQRTTFIVPEVEPTAPRRCKSSLPRLFVTPDCQPRRVNSTTGAKQQDAIVKNTRSQLQKSTNMTSKEIVQNREGHCDESNSNLGSRKRYRNK